ncbi:MAG: NADH-quinone oxidoreductase subunit NuoG [Acidobacteria bacterium]|nr:NADH-quinone oxidoreductase subunit NuoG [Acidobacteriota bacterium]
MSELVKLTIDGKPVEAPAGTLVINAARQVGIEIPAFCYYEGLALQAACRMCLVEVEKAPKLLTACTLPVAKDMVVRTETPQVAAARKAMLEFLLTNHPLDCPVCDKGGECELQDMTFRYGAGESRFREEKLHVVEQQWSPVVYFDAPRCILCFRCVRICDEGMGVRALGVVNRGAHSEIAPNMANHLECDECGMCIDICPVGALTSGAYRYQTRPWEMQYVGAVCAHCADGCKTTLSVRNNQILRGNNRDRSGINGEFLCIKGRYAYDFLEHEERLRTPLVRRDGKLQPAGWKEAIALVAERFRGVKERGGSIGVIGSTRTTNEENYYLQKLARAHLGTNHIDHHQTGDVVSLLDGLAGRPGRLATTADLYNAAAVLIVGADLSQQHPLLAFQIRANVRHHGARVYVVHPHPTREEHGAARLVRARGLAGVESIREVLAGETDLVVVFGDHIKGPDVERLVSMLPESARYVALVDYVNSRGALDMGLLPDLLPGYAPAPHPGLSLQEMITATEQGTLDALWVVGANPLEGVAGCRTFLVVQELFLTETARLADVVFPAAAAYEKSGSFTNVCGEVQRLKQALAPSGAKPDLEIMGLLARQMGFELAPPLPEAVFDEIRRVVRGYDIPYATFVSGGAAQATSVNGHITHCSRPEAIQSSRDSMFTSGSLGRYCRVLQAVIEKDLVEVPE